MPSVLPWAATRHTMVSPEPTRSEDRVGTLEQGAAPHDAPRPVRRRCRGATLPLRAVAWRPSVICTKLDAVAVRIFHVQAESVTFGPESSARSLER